MKNILIVLALLLSTRSFAATNGVLTQGIGSSSGGASTFDQLGSGTNTTAAMVVGSGATLAPTGSGTITATTAAALSTGRTISITGDLAYTSPSFDGSGNVTAAATLATVNSNVGTFGSPSTSPVITVTGKGSVTAVTTVPINTPAYGTPLWNAALLNVINNISNARACLAGDSSTFGAFSDDTGNLGPNSYPNQLAVMLQQNYGIRAYYGGTLGFGTSNNTYGQYDTRWVVGSSWTADSTAISIGGQMLKASTTTNSLDFTETYAYDTISFPIPQISGNGTVSAQVDSGSVVTYSENATGAPIIETISGLALTTHTIHFKYVSGGKVNIQGVLEAYDSTVRHVNIIAAGWTGSASGDWNVATAAYNPSNSALYTALGCNLTILDLGINDWVGSVPTTTYNTNISAIITAMAASGDVMLKSPVPSLAASGVTLATQLTYVKKLMALHVSKAINLLDIWSAWSQNLTQITALDFYNGTQPAWSDSSGIHPGPAGYAAVAEATASAIVTVPTNIYGHVDTSLSSQSLQFQGMQSFNAIQFGATGGQTFTVSGCSASSPVGGATGGAFTAGSSATCTFVITMNGAFYGRTAPHGWICMGSDVTTAISLPQAANTTTTCSIKGAVTSGNQITFVAFAY